MDRADLDRICRYSQLIQRRNELSQEREVSKRFLQNHKDAVAELEEVELLGSSDDLVPVKAGTAFLHVPLSSARAYTEKHVQSDSSVFEQAERDLALLQKEMDTLKKVLNQKFGDAVRLD
jgi:chaperonin cofactor prefoldin